MTPAASSPTACPTCQLAEMTPVQRLFWSRWRALFPPRPSPFASMAAVMRAATGIREPSWEERHSELYATTGDPVELERMLRHVR